jgi:polyhydroxyalkanoate synthesis regulator phasin
MLKNKVLLIIIPVVAVLLVLGIGASAVFAQGPVKDGAPGQALLARVAQILGIDQAKLTSAFKQAGSEMRDERLAGLVTDGKLTQEQVNQIKAWQAARPADPKADPAAFKAWMESRPDVPMPGLKAKIYKADHDKLLEELVKNGKLTQAQADQLKAWWASRPADPRDNPEALKAWLKARPNVPLPGGPDGAKMFPRFKGPPPAK